MERKREKRRCAVEGEREKERKNERQREREREKSVRTSLRGFSRPATYGNVIRAFRWMLSCVFALLRNRVVLPSRSTLPSSFFFSFSSLLLFLVSCLFAFSLQRESMSMRKRFVSASVLSHETSKICVFMLLETDTSPSFSMRNNYVWIFRRFDFNSIMIIIVCLVYLIIGL